ncbi:MAG: hypothetical protein IH986_04960 [Planctomycetes bacterium]|nr:hypothetical protein [Planctomycetota bacterium]
MTPTFEHDVEIPTTLTCIISTDDGEANTVRVSGFATLGVEGGHSLTIDGANALGTVNSLRVQSPLGKLYFKEDAQQNPAELLFNPSVSGLVYTISDGGTVTAESASGYGAGRIARAVARSITLRIASGTTVKGELEFDSLAIDNNGLILVDGSDTLTFGAFASPNFGGSGTYKVNGANATMTFSDARVSGCGTYEVINGIMELVDLTANPVLGNHTITIDGGTFTSDADLRLENSDVTIDNDGSMNITGNLVVQENGPTASTVTIEDGTLDVSGQLRVRKSSVTIKAGLLDTNTVDSDDSTLAIQGGIFKAAGTFFSDFDTITLSGGELELNGAYTGCFTVFTITGGTLDVNENFSNAGSFVTDSSFKNATITVAANKTATFE